MSSKTLRTIIEESVAIPTLPEIASRLDEVVSRPDVGVLQVAREISKDPAISSQILRVANSALFGFRQSIHSVEQAATVLGIEALKKIIVQATVMELLGGIETKRGLDFTALWKHSILTGHLAASLGKAVPASHAVADPDLLYTCGLLHDIGQILLYDSLRGRYVEIQKRTSVLRKPLWQCEQQSLGFNHSDVGALVALRWRLPEAVQTAIQVHHCREDMLAGAQECQIVYAANRIAELIEHGRERDELLLHPAVKRQLDIDEAAYRRIVREAAEFFARIEL